MNIFLGRETDRTDVEKHGTTTAYSRLSTPWECSRSMTSVISGYTSIKNRCKFCCDFFFKFSIMMNILMFLVFELVC